MNENYTIAYPRRVILRHSMRLVARAGMAMLSRTTVTGKENLPEDGPLILVGNHVAMVEVLLMMLHVPWLVEMIGVGDVPLDPTFAPLITTYGYIPINRGSMDRKGMTMALDVLKQGGVIGMFPEGGIWEASKKEARSGVAWLSNKANAPIVPMGFGGMRGALGAMAGFKRPRLTMNIGAVIPPVAIDTTGKSRKQALMDGANYVMEQVEALIPPEEKAAQPTITNEQFHLEITIADPDGSPVHPPAEYAIHEDAALARFFYHKILVNTLARNVRLPVQPLQQLTETTDPAALSAAADAVINYLENVNPYFLTYRFGNDTGRAMQTSLVELCELAQWAHASGCTLSLHAERRYRIEGSTEEIVERI